MNRCASVFLLLTAIFFVPSPSPASSDLLCDWSKRFGDVNSDIGYAVAVDDTGNVVVVGRFALTIDFGGGLLTSAGGYDIFVAKFDSAGTHLWSQRFGNADHQFAVEVALDDDGNVLLTGRFEGSVDFGGGALTSSGPGDYDIFVAKFNSAGTHLWSQRFGDADPSQTGNAIISDGAGNVIVAGEFDGTVDFGGGPLSSWGSTDIFVVKFDPSGAHLWSHRYGDVDPDEVDDIAVDASDGIVLTGSFAGSIYFGSNPTLTSAGGYDIYVVKLLSSGAAFWSKKFGDFMGQKGLGVAVDGLDNVLVTGYFEGTVDFGGGILSSAGSADIFVAKFAGFFGDHIWSQAFGDTLSQIGRDIETNAANDVVVMGGMSGSTDFGGGLLTSAGNEDVFLARFDASGTHLWSDRYGSAANELCLDLAGDGKASYYLTGFFTGSLDFGNAPLTSAGSNDVFLVRFAPAAAAIQAINDVPGDQGGWARVYFHRALHDRVMDVEVPVLNYYIFRRVDEPALITQVANERLARDQRIDESQGVAPLIQFGGRSFLSMPGAAATSATLWEAVATVPARQEDEYIGLVPTLADSGSVLQYSVYFVMAQTVVPSIYYDSPPDSGYSVDNLSPAMPMNLAGEQTGASAMLLTWDANGEADLSHYAVYRGVTIDFPPGPGNLLDTPSSPMLLDNDWTWDGGYYYKVGAVDIHGNESNHAILSPDNASSAGNDSPSLRTYLEQNQPNPFNPTTRIRFGLREAGDVSLRIFDAKGNLVRVLASGRFDARDHVVVWEGRDGRNIPVASGVYFYRLVTRGKTITRKAILLK